MTRITDAAYLCQCKSSSLKADKAAGNLLSHMFLVVCWIVEYIQDKVPHMSGLQILICCSYPGLKTCMKDPKP